jgi:hypothetical protein
MCVWDGTFTPREAEREALDLVPGWRDDPPLGARRWRSSTSGPMQRTRGPASGFVE